jgi:hypothetical protein
MRSAEKNTDDGRNFQPQLAGGVLTKETDMIFGKFTVNSHEEAQRLGLDFEGFRRGRTFLGRSFAQAQYRQNINGASFPVIGPRLIDMSGKRGVDNLIAVYLATAPDFKVSFG